MLGIDKTTISRFDDLNEKFIKKFLHPNEIKDYKNSKNKSYFLASRWAIKEALYKADNSFKNFSKIDLKKVRNQFLFEGFKISTTSEEDSYIAIVMKEK